MRSDVFIKNLCELETIPEGAKIQLTLASPKHQINIEMNLKTFKNTGPSWFHASILEGMDFISMLIRYCGRSQGQLD